MIKPPQNRADLALVTQGLAPDQAKAQALIMSGVVYAGTRRIDKAATMIGADEILRVKTKATERGHDYVSRGALKLIAALDHFAIDPLDKICADIGASTGGFTEVLLRRGAAKIYAVDSGTNQLDWKLRQDPRVVVMEQTSARSLTAAMIPDAPRLIVADVSFMSLTLALPAILALAAPDAQLVALIKPQFEADPAAVASGGIVTDAAVRTAACAKVQNWLATTMQWPVLGIIDSPITGHDGNHEYLIAAQRRLP
jgi:23S rRNA (cytidine1920-2'-O)/16S rRNA (cytidine1409-2'-O)-methyltransferase